MSSGFDGLEQAISLSEALEPIQADETAFADETLDDSDALGIVLQDAQSALQFLSGKGLLPAGIDNADELVRAYSKPKVWADGKPRANLPMFVVMEAIEK